MTSKAFWIKKGSKGELGSDKSFVPSRPQQPRGQGRDG
jgi:hypothetical protein